ncbi:MAG TPA: hypothetical protein V6C76_11485 [Drouetiella sp.]
MKYKVQAALMAVALLCTVQGAEAGILHKLTHLGVTHKASKVLGAPFYVAGFATCCIGGLVGIPFKTAVQDFESRPFVSF